MSLDKKYSKEVKQILSKYPAEHKRSAVMPLLYLAQREEGYVNKEAIQDIARVLDMTETEVASIIGFYSLYHDKKAGKYRMQVCTDLPCALRGADEFLANAGISPVYPGDVVNPVRTYPLVRQDLNGDDVLVTEGRPEVLTRAVPKQIDEVEAIRREALG